MKSRLYEWLVSGDQKARLRFRSRQSKRDFTMRSRLLRVYNEVERLPIKIRKTSDYTVIRF